MFFFKLFFYVCFFSFFCCLLYCLSHHLKGRVHDSDPIGGYDRGSTVSPGYSSTRQCFLCSSFDFFQSMCFFALALSPDLPMYFLFFCLFIFTSSLFYIWFCVSLSSFFFLKCVGVAGVCSACHSPAQWHGIVLLSTWYLVQRSCLCRSFVTTELVSL